MSEKRRLAKFEITPELLVQAIRSGNPIQPDGALFWKECDLPADTQILHAEWNYASHAIVAVCESQEFPEVATALGALPELPYRTVLCHSHHVPAEDLVRLIESRRAEAQG